MEEKILLDVEFNNAEVKDAIKNISAGRKAIDELTESNKKLAASGQKNSIEYVKNQESIRALTVEVNQNSKVVQASTQANKANADSMEALKAKNIALVAERKKLSTETEEGRKRITEINAAIDKNNVAIDANTSKTEKQKASLKGMSGIVDTIIPGFSGFTQTLGGASSSMGIATESAKGLGLGFKIMLGPISLLLLAVAALITYLTSSEEGMDTLAKIAAQVNAVLGVLKNTVIQVGAALAAFTTGDISGGVEKLAGAFENLDGRLKDAVNSAGELADIMDTLDELRLQAQVRNDEEANQIKNLIIQSKSRLLTEQQRNDLLAKASELEKRITGEKLGLQLAGINASTRQFLVDSDRLDLAQKEGETTLEFTKRIINSQDLLLSKRKELADQLGQYNSLLDNQANVQEKIQNQQDAIAEKAEADAAKRAEAEKKRLEEIDKKKEELSKRELTAGNELEILRLEKEARELQGIKNQTDALIEVERTRAAQLLENTELTQSEKEKIIFESEEKINQILVQSREREEFERKAGLQNSLEDFTEYTQGLIDAEKQKYIQGLITKEEYDEQIQQLELTSLEIQGAIKAEFGEEDMAQAQRISDYKIKLGEEELKIKKAQEQQKIDAVKTALSNIASALNKNSIAYKITASILTTIDTIQSAISAYKSLSGIPYVGPILGAIAAAAATASGLAAVAKINATQIPKFEEGGEIPLHGPRHSQGGMDVHVGNKKVANVEGGERMVILKRGARPSLLRDLATVNMLAGGRDFFADRAPRYHNLDGGFIARSAASDISSSQQRNINQQVAATKIYTRITDIHRVEGNMEMAEVISELR